MFSILELVNQQNGDSNSNSLASCRPFKVIHYLQVCTPQQACYLVYTADSSSLLQLTCVCLSESGLISVENKVRKSQDSPL